jgi:hypothetical protein
MGVLRGTPSIGGGVRLSSGCLSLRGPPSAGGLGGCILRQRDKNVCESGGGLI